MGKFRQLIFTTLVACLFSVAFSGQISTTNWKLQILKVFDIIENNYVEDDITNEQLVHKAIEGMLESLDDPYTRFLKPKNYSDMKMNLQGNFYGIGIHIGMKDDKLTVISPIDGTPADKVGLVALDTIVSINSESAEGISLEEAVTKIRGERGTKVALGIQRKGVTDSFIIEIVRDSIKIKSIRDDQMITDKIGYIRLSTFESKETFNELRDAIKKLQKEGMEKLIVDVRFNGGGLLQNALDIAGLFIGNDVVVYTVGRDGEKHALMSGANNSLFDGPLVVLVNGSSASASEILAGAIRDHDRGALIGTQTFGKASVQHVVPLIDDSALLLTIAKYLTPKGDNIHHVGITPDIVSKIPSADIELMKSGKYVYVLTKDSQVREALRYLESN